MSFSYYDPPLLANRAGAAQDRAMQIQVFSDVVCPWCFIGTVRLDRALDALALDATVTYLPFMIAADAPPGGFNVADDLRRKYGVDPKQLWARAEAEARKSGLELDLAKQTMSYPTAAAHTLIRHAAGKGTQRPLVRALHATYFQGARDISDPEVLAEVGARHGFSPDEVRALVTDPAELGATRRAVNEAFALGVSGAPFFVIDDAVAFSGAQPEEVFRQILEDVRQGTGPG
jgi:predicted DsbA family dithiol-disulfide isomerase